MIYPRLSPQYYEESDQELLKFMESFYADSITINQSFWGEADTDHRFYAGDQEAWGSIYGNAPLGRNQQFSFNRIRRVVSMIEGHQRKNRKSTVVVPVENADQETADQFSQIFIWLNRQEGVLHTISDAFKGALIGGMDLLHVWLDYRKDPVSGDIKIDRCPYNSFIIDPYFKKTDLSDCKAIWKRSYITRREAIALLPTKEDEILNLQNNAEAGSRDGKFQFMAESYNYGYSNMLTYDEFYYRDYRNQELLVDTQTGETIEWTLDDEYALNQFLIQYPQIELIKQEVPTVRLAIVVQGKVLYHGLNPMGIDYYPFVPVFAYYMPEIPYYPWRVQGVVRGLRDAQYLYNRRKQIELDILESQVNSGFVYKENALVNPKDIFLSGQGKGIAIKEEADINDVQRIQPATLNESIFNVSQLLGQEMIEISGVSEELLGSADDDKAGILSMLRQGAALTTLQGLFDQLDYAQKLLGRVLLNTIQVNFTPGKVKRILQEEPTNQFYNKAFGRYDAAIEEGINTTTQRQMQLAQALHLRQTGVPITDEFLIESSTLQNKTKLMEQIQQQQQQQQAVEQQRQQLQMQEMQARTNLANAQATADHGLGYERISRIQENERLAQERGAKAIGEIEKANLDKVKALKELEDMDLDQIERLVNLAGKIKEYMAPERIAQQELLEEKQPLEQRFSLLDQGKTSFE